MIYNMDKYDDYQLDVEYRNSLSAIKTFIPNISTNYYMNHYRLWLEKISNMDDSQKYIRNCYLTELTEEIQKSTLKYPFIHIPPKGPLPPFPIHEQFYPQHEDDFNIGNVRSYYWEKPASKHKNKKRKSKLVRTHTFKSKGRQVINVNEENSWSDLFTEESVISLRASSTLDVPNRNPKNDENQKIIDEPQTSNSNDISICDNDANMETNKNQLKGTNFISADWKRTIEALQLRLTETTLENNELKSYINTLQMQIQENELAQNELKMKITDLKEKEMREVEEKHSEIVNNLEKSYQVKLFEVDQSYNYKIEDLETNYQTRLKNREADFETELKQKEEDITRLNSLVQDQCLRLGTEVSCLKNYIDEVVANNNGEDKIVFLQKCVSKMDKVFQTLEKEYVKQIEKLQNQLEYKDKVAQIQMKTQRAELITKTSSEKQSQFDSLVSNLEVRYKHILELQEAQMEEINRQYEAKLEKLKIILDLNRIPYEINAIK